MAKGQMKVSGLALGLLVVTGLTITAASSRDAPLEKESVCDSAAKDHPSSAQLCAPKREEKPKSYHPTYL